MIRFGIRNVLPAPQGSTEEQVRACLSPLIGDRDRVAALTFFVDAVDTAGYRAQRDTILAAVRETFGEAPPPASVVAQAPERGLHAALEAAVVHPDHRIERREHAGHPYTVVVGEHGRAVFGAGFGSELDETHPAERARQAFGPAEAVLAQEGLTFGHVVRQWNYLEGMLDVRRAEGQEIQGYQALNDVRTLVYDRADFFAGYPAATGIGQAAGGVIIEFLALDVSEGVEVTAVSNPKQIDAHAYSEDVLVGEALPEVTGKASPKFERAKRVARADEETVFVSGTASILGEKSVALGDVAEQTRVTLANIAALVANRPLTRLRAYVKRTADIPVVREVCEAAYGPIPALYVTADVCRDELLVELEGSLAVPGTDEI